MTSSQSQLTLETAHGWARSGHEWDKVYRFIFLHPEDFFAVPNRCRWSIAHQVVYHGDVDLFKRILSLFSDDQINIRTLSNDKKTLRDVADERKKIHQTMYIFIEHLFLQDDLMQAAKQSNWRSVSELLENNPALINEKPPYSTYFLLHYLVQNGGKDILEDLLRRFQFQTNVLSSHNETPLDMAKRLKKDDLCSILEPETRERSRSFANRYELSSPQPPQNLDAPNEKPTLSTSVISPVEPPSSAVELPYPKTNPFPSYGFFPFIIDLSKTGNFTVTSDNPFTSLPTDEKQSAQTDTKHIDKKETSVTEKPETSLELPLPVTPNASPTNLQVMKNLTCTLTQQIFVDPVIAGDGQTYEREAIAEWVDIYHCSPTTGAPMNAIFKDNTEVKQIIQSMRTTK